MIRWIRNNRLLFAASIFFIAWKFLLISILWDGRIIPPEPDDSYTYIGYIYSVQECETLLCEYPYLSLKSYTGFTYFSYRLVFGTLAKVFQIDPLLLFQTSFYLGTLALVPVLIALLKSLTTNRTLAAATLFFLAFYNGSGAYHGFFWVVPSFFMTLLFFLLFAVALGRFRHWFVTINLLVPLFIFMHPLSIYSLSIFAAYFVLYTAFSKKIDLPLLGRILTIITFSLIWYGVYTAYLNSVVPYNPISPPSTIVQTIDQTVTAVTGSETTLPSWPMITINYFWWLLPHWVFILPLALCFSVLFYYRQFKILALYGSIFLYVVATAMHPEGFRNLVFLWPITFVLLSFGVWHIILFLNQHLADTLRRTILKGIVVTGIVFYGLIHAIYSVFWNMSMNTKNNFPLDGRFAAYLTERTLTYELIQYHSKLIHSYSLNTPLIHRSIFVDAGSPPKYLVVFYNSQTTNNEESSPLNAFFDTTANLLHLQRGAPPSPETVPDLQGYVLEKDFGGIKIYKNLRYSPS